MNSNSNNISVLKSELLLLLAAFIWGFAFVAQKVGMDSLGPMAYNGIRFLVGSISLLPIIYFQGRKKNNPKYTKIRHIKLWKAGIVSGLVLFAAASIQQFGIVYTTAGNAGFITSLYVVLVPVFGLLFKHKVNIQTWIGAIVALGGLYLLSVNNGLTLVIGDALVLVSAIFWAAQVLLASYYSTKVDIIKLATIQFALTGTLSLVISFFTETYGFQDIYNAMIPILYGGIMSVGIAFSLQLIAQKNVIPSHAAIILSTESLFAALGGWILLNEKLTPTEVTGAALMFLGIILSQLKRKSKYDY